MDETVELVKASGGNAYGYVCDITKNQEVYATAEDVKNKVGRVSTIFDRYGGMFDFRFLSLGGVSGEFFFLQRIFGNPKSQKEIEKNTGKKW